MRGSGEIEYPEDLIHYTKVKPHLSYCENPMFTKCKFPNRKEVLSTVPRDIEDTILGFINSIRPKRSGRLVS